MTISFYLTKQFQ